MLQNAGALRPDGSDKFFGLENVSAASLAILLYEFILSQSLMLTLVVNVVR